MIILTQENPGNKSYKIVEFNEGIYFCYPRTEPEKLELLYCYNGNQFNGDLDLENGMIHELPDNLIVNGNLDLSDAKLNDLPDNLTVNGNLNISNIKIYNYPECFIVNDMPGDGENPSVSKLLNHSKIRVLPKDLKVSGNFYIQNTNFPYNYKFPIGITGKICR